MSCRCRRNRAAEKPSADRCQVSQATVRKLRDSQDSGYNAGHRCDSQDRADIWNTGHRRRGTGSGSGHIGICQRDIRSHNRCVSGYLLGAGCGLCGSFCRYCGGFCGLCGSVRSSGRVQHFDNGNNRLYAVHYGEKRVDNGRYFLSGIAVTL